MLPRPTISKMLADTLDAWGYSEKRIQERVWMNEKNSLAKTLSTREIVGDQTIDKFLVGSQREGVSLFGESDSDWMQVNNSVVCTDKLRNIKDKRNERVIFRLVRKNIPAGYTQLQYITQNIKTHPYFDKLLYALEETEHGTFLSSTKYMEVNEDVFYNNHGYIGRNTVYMDRQGPSNPKSVIGLRNVESILDQYDICRDIDIVRGFRCLCPSLLNEWLHRTRPFNWPNKDTKVKISTLPYHLVPVGLADTPGENLQWRISFTMAEICLIQSFNETQRKVLILLRLIARYLLKPVAPDVTSYIMKNVTFWMVERTPVDKFTNNNIFDRVMDAIDFLILSVKNKRLRNYMIPKRNILRGKLQGKQSQVLIAKLHQLKVNGHVEISTVLQSRDINHDYPELAEWLTNTGFKNTIDKIKSVEAFPVSVTQRANYFTACFRCYFAITLLCTHLLHLMNCIPVFGFKWLSDPMSIDLVKKAMEGTKTLCFCYPIARNKAKTKQLFRLERCGWVYCKTFQICGRFTRAVSVLLLCILIILNILSMIRMKALLYRFYEKEYTISCN